MPVDLASIGMTGIFAAEAEVAATESNIANASNPNYSAESVNLAALAGPDGAGSGVAVLGTQRSQAPFLDGEINSQSSTQSYNQAFTQIGTLAQNLIAPTGGNDLGQAFQNMMNAFTKLAAAPQQTTLRSAAISAASSFASTTQTLSAGLQHSATDALSQIGTLVSQVNTLSSQIASLNSQIRATQSGSAAALLDQRDGLVGQLANLIGATTDSNGDVNVAGVPLVSGTQALTVETTGTGTNVGLAVVLPHGTLPMQTTQVGGTIGGTFASAESISQLQTSVNQYANSVATAINRIYQNGYGLDGSTGNQLFAVSNSGGPISINSAVTPQNFAAASTAAGVPGDGSNASAMAALASTVGVDSSFPDSNSLQAFTAIQSQFGSSLQTAQTDQQQASSTLQSLQQLKSSITGVSLNDQLTKLIQYQNALEAAGRAVQAANDITTFLVQQL
ncbi:MAG TPA: flagellar hook-associated protein FlgK [Candidatus Binataceae bacterium]|nr:flagellar hook-associated protein FlgK [Candidatus Binataceae bacterium]